MIAVGDPIHCRLCGSNHNRPLIQKSWRGRTLMVDQCRECGLAFLRSSMADFDEDLYTYYEKYAHRSKKELFTELNRRSCQEALHRLEKLAPGKHLLDVGAGFGFFVEAAIELGWRAEGIDLSASAVATAVRFGVPVRERDFFSGELIPQSYDVLLMSEFIEHVPQPKSFILRSGELLKTGGLLYVTTPNFASLDRRLAGADWDPIHGAHLSYFTPATFRRLMDSVGGFEAVQLTSRNASPALLKKAILDRWPGSRRSIPAGDDLTTGDQEMRGRIEASPLLRRAKRVLNRGLGTLSLGSTLVAIYRKV